MVAVQLAKWRGARVLATASGRDGVAFVRRLGIDNVIDGKKGDIAVAARELAPDGVDAVLAFAGGDDLARCVDTLKKGGRVVYPDGIEPAPRKRKNIRVSSYHAVASPQNVTAPNRAVGASKLEGPIEKSNSLARAAD